MKVGIIAVALLAALLLTGCGLKGDLYLEDTGATRAAPPVPESDAATDEAGAGIEADMGTVEDVDATEDPGSPLDDTTGEPLDEP